MQTTISLKKVSVGTELTAVQESIPSVIPADACYLGWQESLTLLAQQEPAHPYYLDRQRRVARLPFLPPEVHEHPRVDCGRPW